MDLPTCGKCGVPLSLPAGCCAHCGEPITVCLPDPNALLRRTANDTDPNPTLPPETAANQDDATKVETLLRNIAGQSHFEERYDIRGLLAEGGMGQIFRAYDQILRREIAIKMTREDLRTRSSPAVRGQFLKEARVGGRLLHPNVLPVFDLGVNRSGHIYYTMRLVDGSSLRHCL